MNAKLLLTVMLLIVLILAPITPSTHGETLIRPTMASRSTITDSSQAQVTEALHSSPVMFIENVGQFADGARFQVRGGDKTIWLTEDEIWVTVVEEPPPTPRLPDGRHPSPLSVTETETESGASGEVQGVNIRLSFSGANPHPRLEPFNRLETVVSYFIGNDPAQWRVAVPVWGGVRYRDLYPGIDLEITGEGGHLVQRLVTRPGANLSAVRLRVEGADAVTPTPSPAAVASPNLVGRAGWEQGLLLRTALGDFTLPLLQVEEGIVKPALVQQVDRLAFEVAHPFTVENGADSAPLSIAHPQQEVSLLYAGFLGGSHNDRGNSIAVDAAGNAYVTGYTGSHDFPAVVGPDTSYNDGDRDAFVAKVNPSGTGLVYAGFLGGSDWDGGYGIAVDAAGNAYVTGYTESHDFPAVVGPDTSYNGGSHDAFVAKVNPSGTGLVYAGFLGGSDIDEGNSIAVDAAGNAYVTGGTISRNFPAVVGPDTSYNGSRDAFVAKVNPSGTGLVYAGFLGGSDIDDGNSIAVDAAGNAYVTGGTTSRNFPAVVGPDTSYNGGYYDAFVAKVNPSGTGLVYAGFLGGSDWDVGTGIAVDAAGNAYVTGTTSSSNFPAVVGPDTSYNGGDDAFVAKVNPSGAALLYAGFLGGSDRDGGTGIAVDAAGNAYVTGTTSSSNFPAVVGPDTSYNGGDDAFVAKVNPSGTALLYAGFLGGSYWDVGNDIAVDAAGNAYVTGETFSSNFPAVVGPDTSYNGGDDAFVAKVGAGGGSEPFSANVAPIWPRDHTVVSPVMRGGTAYRYFRLLDSGGNPIPNAIVRFSTGSPTTTDAQGYFTYTILADALGNLGRYSISIQSITVGGQTYPTNNQPTFGVEVRERRYSHAWSYGASTRAKGGVSAGYIAYLQGTTSGGLELKLDESNPDATSDDVVLMKEDFSDEIGAGGGVGIEKGVSVVILQVKGGASATAELALRSSGSIEARFPQPYADNDRKAEGVFLLASAIDSIGQALPDKPFTAQLLKLALDRAAPYRDYISEQQAALGGKIKPIQANVGASASLGLKRSGATWKERLLGFDLVDVGVTVVHLNLLTDYRDRNEWGLGFESEHDVDWSLLSWNIGDFKNKFAGTIGDRAKKVKVELIFDSNTDALKRLELSFTGEGNPYAFTDVLKEKVTVKLIIPADQLGSGRLGRTVNILRLLWAAQQVRSDPLSIGPSAMLNELNNLLDGLGYAEYEVNVEDGAETRWETELGVTAGIDIELGPGLEVKKTRDLVRERGVFLNGKPYVTETYNADSYVSRPGKSWWDLTTNALGGLWLLVQDAFNWVGQQVTSGVGWVIGTVSRTVQGIIRGGAQIIAPPETQLYARSFGAQGVAIQQTAPITVTAIGWVPEAAAGAGALSLRPALAASSGEGFVVGGIYEFQPYNLTLDPAATLVITYTNEAALGIDESRIGMFRWNPAGNHWQPMPAIADTTNNVFTATITQLGTFALGYDATPPQISVSAPMNGSTITNTLPLISALVVDTGVGIDPATVEMRLDGQVVAATYITGTGELMYMPPAPLSAGQHTVTVSARDVVGNQASATISFSIGSSQRYIYLPLIRR
jgi:hypothetical protein